MVKSVPIEIRGNPKTFQHTLAKAIHCEGVGLHNGLPVSLSLRPGAANSGIIFNRTDVIDADPLIPARWDHVTDTTLCTTIGNDDGVKIATIEHLMAALAGCGIDNAVIDINGAELPAMDGSAEPFVFLIGCAGLTRQDAVRRTIRVLRPIEVDDGNRFVAFDPSPGFSASFEIDFDSHTVGQSRAYFDLCNGAFKRDIGPARTFGFERDVVRLQAMGLARGGSLDNAVIIGDDDSILNEGGLRFEDEFVRHKILDCVGDLALAGAPLLAHFTGFCSGHEMNNRLLVALFSDDEAWEYCDLAAAPSPYHPETAFARLETREYAKRVAVA